MPQQPVGLAVVTGSNTGIGLETARGLAARGFTVVLACRSTDKGEQARQQVLDGEGDLAARLLVMKLDLSSFDSVRAFVRELLARGELPPLRVLVLNAGLNVVGMSKDLRTAEGYDLTFGTNYLGHFLLVNLLLETLKRNGPSRVVSLSSVTHRTGRADYARQFHKSYHADGYATSKLALTHLAFEIQRRYAADGVMGIAVNPGAVNSDIWRNWPVCLRPLFRVVFLTTAQGAACSIHAATTGDVAAADEDVYFSPYRVFRGIGAFDTLGPFAGPQRALPSPLARDRAVASDLWQMSLDAIAK